MVDAVDLKVLFHLMRQGRMTWADLAGRLSLSSPAAADRVHRLEDRQVITGYAALVAPEAIGLDLLAFVFVTLEHPRYRQAFIDRIHAMTTVQECHHLAGDDDYLLKVRGQNTRHLEHLISDELKALPGVRRTRTAIALSSVKETTILPLPSEDMNAEATP